MHEQPSARARPSSTRARAAESERRRLEQPPPVAKWQLLQRLLRLLEAAEPVHARARAHTRERTKGGREDETTPEHNTETGAGY